MTATSIQTVVRIIADRISETRLYICYTIFRHYIKIEGSLHLDNLELRLGYSYLRAYTQSCVGPLSVESDPACAPRPRLAEDLCCCRCALSLWPCWAPDTVNKQVLLNFYQPTNNDKNGFVNMGFTVFPCQNPDVTFYKQL